MFFPPLPPFREAATFRPTRTQSGQRPTLLRSKTTMSDRKESGRKPRRTPNPSPAPELPAVVFTFGKHAGKPLVNVEASYLRWALRKIGDLAPALREGIKAELLHRKGSQGSPTTKSGKRKKSARCLIRRATSPEPAKICNGSPSKSTTCKPRSSRATSNAEQLPRRSPKFPGTSTTWR